ncbi:hypothetical protein WMY93_021065 [Mugilogobius chulae]|uniref:G-protein coupled receptors family 1 profile domain-containing protein n=1 Tax=Mugilogobius chulae TaxID=88201 RepID=A0AAW0NB64_9GOBI
MVLNTTYWPEPEGVELSYQVVTSVLLGALILCAIIGNACVVAAIVLERSLQTVSNFLIGSLAVTDLMVSVLVLPMAALYQVLDRWALGPFACHIFVSLDVLCCTSSILHLQPRSLAHDRANPRQCHIWQDPWYTIYSTFGAFYIPLVLMLVLYGRIFKAARFRIRRTTRKTERNKVTHCWTAASPRILHSTRVEPLNSTAPPADEESLEIVETVGSKVHPLPLHSPRPLFQPHSQSSEAQRKLALARERKAVKTLGVIMGTFILCWLPFFIVALVKPFCQLCSMPRWIHDVINWLGYSNSLLNPLIYAFCNKDFRRAFSRILHCHYCAQ